MAVDGERSRFVARQVHVQGRPVDSFPDLPPEAERGSPRRITEVGEEVLSRPCREVTAFGTPELSSLIDDMFLTMYIADGAGLAANQVGVDLRLFVYDCPDDDGVRHVGHIINPVLETWGVEEEGLAVENEGCLSVPGPHAELPRAPYARVTGFDRDGTPVTVEGSGYFARCLQHETDHTLGRLYIDRLSKRERKKVLKTMNDMKDQVFARRAENAETMRFE